MISTCRLHRPPPREGTFNVALLERGALQQGKKNQRKRVAEPVQNHSKFKVPAVFASKSPSDRKNAPKSIPGGTKKRPQGLPGVPREPPEDAPGRSGVPPKAFRERPGASKTRSALIIGAHDHVVGPPDLDFRQLAICF